MAVEVVPLISFVFITTFTPGPNNISSASMGILLGYKKSLHYLFGIVSGFFVVMFICALLSSFILKVLPFAETYLRWIGSLYILWLAISILKADYSVSPSEIQTNSFAKGMFLQLLNPKGIIYALTLYSTFLAPISDRFGLLMLFALAFTIVGFAAISFWTLCGAVIKNKLKNDAVRKVINTSLSLLLVYTALKLSGIL